jgi:hypothetical protein
VPTSPWRAGGPRRPAAITSGFFHPKRMQACARSKAPAIAPPTAIANRALLLPDAPGAESPVIRISSLSGLFAIRNTTISKEQLVGAPLLEERKIDCVGHSLIAGIVRMKMIF